MIHLVRRVAADNLHIWWAWSDRLQIVWYSIKSATNWDVSISVQCQVLGAFAKLRKATVSTVVSVRSSVRPHGTTRLPVDEFL